MHVSSNRPVSEDEKADDVCSRRHLYCDTPVVTSWAVAGQQVVFLHMYLQTRVTLEAFPVATPRGRSSSSHEGEHGLPWYQIQNVLNVPKNYRIYILTILIYNHKYIILICIMVLFWNFRLGIIEIHTFIYAHMVIQCLIWIKVMPCLLDIHHVILYSFGYASG